MRAKGLPLSLVPLPAELSLAAAAAGELSSRRGRAATAATAAAAAVQHPQQTASINAG
jgi:hypothetical protein